MGLTKITWSNVSQKVHSQLTNFCKILQDFLIKVVSGYQDDTHETLRVGDLKVGLQIAVGGELCNFCDQRGGLCNFCHA